MRLTYPIVAVLAAWLGICSISIDAAVSFPAGLKIMPLGDSITCGNANAGYRGPLHDLLSPVAPNFQFVGVSSANPGSLPTGQRQHNGFSSYATLDISNNLDGVDTAVYAKYGGSCRDPAGGYWLTGANGTGRTAVYPDVILLMVGANDNMHDVDQTISLANYRTNLTTLVTKLVTMRPDARLIMADITPEPNDTVSIAAINNDINVVAAEFQSRGNHVSLVDLFTGFPTDGLSDDKIHPNDTGYQWMASRWCGAICDAYAVPEPSAWVLMVNGCLGLLALLWWNRG